VQRSDHVLEVIFLADFVLESLDAHDSLEIA
jgi:hypothetical protein